MSFRSAAPINRPSGIFPGANVFQVPPPAVDASAVSPVTVGAGDAPLLGATATAIAGVAAAGPVTATAGPAGVAALATCIGVAVGGGAFCATTGACEATAVGAGL